MSDDNTNPVDISDDLDAFSNAFFGKEAPKEETPEPVKEEEESEKEDTTEEDSLATNEDEDEEQEEEEEEKPQPKKRKSAQERINELTAKAREAERRAEEAERRLREKEAQKEEVKDKEPAPVKTEVSGAPDPDALNDKGEALYPLGEFDPKYIRDLTKFTIEQEKLEMKREMEAERQRAEMEAAEAEIRETWIDNVAEAEKEIPDLREKISSLGETFADIEPAYGDFLAATIMSMEYGPEIMYHLATNIGEAQKIVASGPAAAALALGRLEATIGFQKEQKEVKRNMTKVSKAPEPPAATVRGSGGKFAVSPDTDDLDAFEREFFKRR